MDAEYLEAVEQGDMETAQRMVDEAAEKAMGQKNAPPEQRYSLTPDTDIEEENIRNGKEALIQMYKMAEEAENPENDKETAVYATGEVYGSAGATAVTPTHTRRNGVDTTVSKLSLSNEGENVKQNYSVSEEMDAEYLAAVEQGDMETAQIMVDEAAEKATGQKTAPPEQRFSADAKKNTKTSAASPLARGPAMQGSFSAVTDTVTAAANNLGIVANVTQFNDDVKNIISVPESIADHHVLSRHEAREWVSLMRNADGNRGEHRNMEQTKAVQKQYGFRCDEAELLAVINALYSDYSYVMEAVGVTDSNVEFGESLRKLG